MDANQESLENPFGMDENCERCPELCKTRSRVVHGYGDAGAEFVVVGEQPGSGTDTTGVPFTGDPAGQRLQGILGDLGLSGSPPDSDHPNLDNVYLTYLTRCRHPDRGPTDAEVRNCEPYLDGDLRMVNPEIIVPVGERVFGALAVEHTTRSPDDFDIEREHATTIRGRGFELVPMVTPGEQTDAQTEEFVEHMADVMGRDYRQTKGRRGR